MLQPAPDDNLADRIRECVLELLVERGPGRSICPSEAARLLGVRMGCRWQELMRPVRTIASNLADEYRLVSFVRRQCTGLWLGWHAGDRRALGSDRSDPAAAATIPRSFLQLV